MKSPDQPETDQLALPAQPPNAWLSVAAMLADLAFETDCQGRFTAFGPGKVLGYPAARLLGSPASALLYPALKHDDAENSAAAFNAVIATICTECVSWQGKVRVSPADGNGGFYRIALAPRINANGSVIGTYGLLLELQAAELPLPDAPATGGRALAMLDDETGLWSAKTFAEETSRRFDRLDVEELPGTLMFLGFSRAPKALQGAIALRLTEELRDIVRPTDILGRIDASTIALWCDGMDHLTGAERAARFCGQFPAILPGDAVVTAGLAPRWPGSADDAQTLVERAGVALRLADLATERAADPAATGEWRVWQQD